MKPVVKNKLRIFVKIIGGQCILHNGEDLHVNITVFCDVAPHNVLYGGLCCLPPSSEISEGCHNLYSLPDIVK